MASGFDARTADDYETLRNYATGGGEVHDSVELELAAFITNGAATWIRSCRHGCSQGRAKWERPLHGGGQNLLALLLANMIESRGMS